jgi:polysaccharide pyruvyl transferase WcaK-like protein
VLEPIPLKLPEELEAHLKVGALGVNLSPLLADYSDSGKAWPTHALECLEEIDRRVDMPIILVPHVETPGSDDFAFLGALKEDFGRTRNRIHVLGRCYNAPQLKSIISRLVAFVGARTHATIAALSTCVPTLSIAYSVKAVGITTDLFGDDRWALRFQTLTPGVIGDKLRDLLGNKDLVRRHLLQVMPGYKEAAYKAGYFLRQCLTQDAKGRPNQG